MAAGADVVRSRDGRQRLYARQHDDERVRSRAGLTGERTARRDHALLALALATGLRAVELCGLDIGDLTREWHAGHEDWWLALPDAKTKGQHGGRTLPLAAELVETLMEYVRATGRHWEDEGDRLSPLVLSGRRPSDVGGDQANPARVEERAPGKRWGRLSTAQVRRIVDRVETQWRASNGEGIAEGRAISPHALRHSTAVALLEGNDRAARPPASVEHVRGWLGHFDIRTTQGYLAHLDARRHRRPFTLRPDPAAQERESGDKDKATD
jgi:site-specific recombinase XerD